jgi:hypothetical protein
MGRVIAQLPPAEAGSNSRIRSNSLVKSEKYALYAAVVGALDILCRPVVTEQVFGHFDHDVVSRCVSIIIVARESLQTGRAGGKNLDLAGEAIGTELIRTFGNFFLLAELSRR